MKEQGGTGEHSDGAEALLQYFNDRIGRAIRVLNIGLVEDVETLKGDSKRMLLEVFCGE